MTALLRIAGLTAVYLLALTSLRPGDILVGLVLSVLLVAGGRRIRPFGASPDSRLGRRLAGVPALVGGTLVDLATSTWRTTV
jgi:multisubunit Na+/H+ antiporter MnhE subunit